MKKDLSRRQVLGGFASAGGLVYLGCDGDSASGKNFNSDGGDGSNSPDSPLGDGATASCSEIPAETAGPFPGDGSNGVNVLSLDGIVRSDIRASFGSSRTVAQGVAMTIKLRVLDLNNGCAAFPGAAVYVWHCDAEGGYSLYSPAVAGENYLRGVQVADENGDLVFESIFPGCYPGRWPHVHFEVYADLAATSNASNKIATSQMALPEAVCDEVYAGDGYPGSATELAKLSLNSDNVFNDDGAVHQLATISGSAQEGVTASLSVVVVSAGR